MQAHYQVDQEETPRSLISPTTGLLVDIDGKELTARNGEKAWVTYQGGEFSNNKKSREDAYFLNQLDPRLMDELKTKNDNEQRAIIVQALEEAVKKLQEQCGKDLANGGTTLSVAFAYNGKLYVACVGDSPICTYDGQKLSDPIVQAHDAKNKAEVERYKKNQGFMMGTNRFVTLLVSRSIGVFAEGGANQFPGLTSKPQIEVVDMQQQNVKQILIASDGVDKEVSEQGTVREMIAKDTSHVSLQEKAANVFSSHKDRLKKADDTTIMVTEPKEGVLYGVCDGHGGYKSAYTVSENFAAVLSQELASVLGVDLSQTNTKTETATTQSTWVRGDTPQTREENAVKVAPPSDVAKSIPSTHPTPPNYGERLGAMMAYINQLSKWYSALHPTTRGNDRLSKLIEDCNRVNGEEVNTQMKLFLIQGLLDKFLEKYMKANGLDNLNALITHLNSERSEHHATRLVTMLYTEVRAIGVRRNEDRFEQNPTHQLLNGKPTMSAHLIKSLFRKQQAQAEPYQMAKQSLDDFKAEPSAKKIIRSV